MFHAILGYNITRIQGPLYLLYLERWEIICYYKITDNQLMCQPNSHVLDLVYLVPKTINRIGYGLNKQRPCHDTNVRVRSKLLSLCKLCSRCNYYSANEQH